VRDPLAGQRDAVNKGLVSALYWPDQKGSPVKVGEIFALRSCHIEITQCHRVRKGGELVWRAGFTRFGRSSDKPYLLGHSGITTDPRYAIRAQDDPNPGTLDRPLDREEREPAHLNQGEPPEPEGLPAAEIASLPTSLEAQQRYVRTQAEIRHERVDQPLSERVRQLEHANGADLTRQFARIEQGVAAAEAKQQRLGIKIPSDRAA